MNQPVLADTGPLVAYFDRSDSDHGWAKDCLTRFTQPLQTCEAVIAETLFLLRRGGISPQPLLKLIARGILLPTFSLRNEAAQVAVLIMRYQDLPMSLADACLVRMAELDDQATVFTLDSNFFIYRKSNRRVLKVLSPKSS